MNRNQKFTKLGNAIREFRGELSRDRKSWVRRPAPGARVRVEKWLGELGIDVAVGMAAVEGFVTLKDMRVWMLREMAKQKQPTGASSPRLDALEDNRIGRVEDAPVGCSASDIGGDEL